MYSYIFLYILQIFKSILASVIKVESTQRGSLETGVILMPVAALVGVLHRQGVRFQESGVLAGPGRVARAKFWQHFITLNGLKCTDSYRFNKLPLPQTEILQFDPT